MRPVLVSKAGYAAFCKPCFAFLRGYDKGMSSIAINGLHHVQLAIPIGSEDGARIFYGGVLGLIEVAKPRVLRHKGGVWFEGEGVALHLGVEDPFAPARKAHPAFAVADLLAARQALADHNPSAVSHLPGLSRFYIADPFGNRIEILQTNDAPFAD